MNRPLLALAVASILGAACGGSSAEDPQTSGDVASRYEIDATSVPDDLRSLIPLAARWGIGDDLERADYVEQASAADREALRAAVQPHQARITAWLDSFGTDPMSDEAAAFMYMQLAIEEMPR
jgi:hypothetical protein